MGFEKKSKKVWSKDVSSLSENITSADDGNKYTYPGNILYCVLL